MRVSKIMKRLNELKGNVKAQTQAFVAEFMGNNGQEKLSVGFAMGMAAFKLAMNTVAVASSGGAAGVYVACDVLGQLTELHDALTATDTSGPDKVNNLIQIAQDVLSSTSDAPGGEGDGGDNPLTGVDSTAAN